MTWLIGWECKSSNALSGPVLIGRGLVPKSIKSHYAVLRVQENRSKRKEAGKAVKRILYLLHLVSYFLSLESFWWV
jgi:hypothetical protein